MDLTKIPHVSHIEWCCTDLAQSERFYRQLFDWNFTRHGQNYALYTPAHGPGPCVGLMHAAQVETGKTCHVFIEVADIRASVNKALTLDARIVVNVTDIPDYGQYAQITDPDQNLVGLFQSSITSEPG